MAAARWSEARRAAAVQSPVIPIVGDLVRRTPGAISLGQGVVHYPPPPQVEAAVAKFFADAGNHVYRPVQGIPELVDAIERKLRDENGIDTAGLGIVVSAGGNMAFMNAVLAIADPGDEIVLQAPYYFNHDMAVALAGCRSVSVDTDADDQLRLDAIEAAIGPRTRAVVTISPNNPTGAVYPEAALRQVNALCRNRGIFHIHDEAYEYFVFDGARHFSPGSIPCSHEYTISLFSLSKSYGMASWRIGYSALPERLVPAVRKIQDTLLICPPVVSQYAALGALGAGRAYCERHLAGFAEVRAYAREQFAAIADVCAVPPAAGAFYFLLRLDTDRPAMEIVTQLVEQHGVAALPGDAFGIADRCCLRVSYGALRAESAREGIGRLVSGLKALLR